MSEDRNCIEMTLSRNGRVIGRNVDIGTSNKKSVLTIVEMEQLVNELVKKFDWNCSFHMYENPNQTVRISLQVEEQDGTEWELFRPFVKKIIKKFWGEPTKRTIDTDVSMTISSFGNSMQNNIVSQGNTYGNNNSASVCVVGNSNSVCRVGNSLGDKIRNEVMSRVGNYKKNKKGKLVSTYVEDFMGNKITEFYDEDDE